MTPATSGPSGPNMFSMFSGEGDGLYRTRRESFVVSLLGQAAILALVIYFMGAVINNGPPIAGEIPHVRDLPLIFSGFNGGGGGNHEKTPASHGNPPKASLDIQLAPPTAIVPKEMPSLPVEETVMVAPDVKMPQGGPIGDPLSKFSARSDGPGGPGGTGDGCCDGVGNFTGLHVGDGPPGIFPAGKLGTSVPQAIYSPEPSFSDEARKAKHQGIVQLMLVVGADGRTYDIRVSQTLGMGLDERAIDAVKRWRFRPATRDGKPVNTRIAIEVEFHLY